MSSKIDDALIEQGLRAAESPLYEQNHIWARHTDEKADLAAMLMVIVRAFGRAVPLDRRLKALSIASSNEPQFRILESAFKGGLCLLDIDQEALDLVNGRVRDQLVEDVTTAQGDYVKDFATAETARETLAGKLGGQPFDLICLHHALYYCDMGEWRPIVEALLREVLAPVGAMHIVMMSATEETEGTTTWLYNRFIDKFFGLKNDQDLAVLRDDLRDSPALAGARLSYETREVKFFVGDFEQFMAVVWMIMLYPDTHRYTLDQRREITEFVIEHFWRDRRPLVQLQDNLVIHRGLDFPGGP